MQIDNLLLPLGWQKGSGDWVRIEQAIERGETVQIIQEVGSTLWQNSLSDHHPFYFGFPDAGEKLEIKGRIWISFTQRKFSEQADFPKGQWHPRVLWIGIGCIRGTSPETIAQGVEQVCQRYHLARKAIAGLATVETKAQEKGILAYCESMGWPLKTFSAQALSRVAVPNPSPTAARAVGTPSVAEAAAILAGGKLLVAKQKVKEAVTVAIAVSETEYTEISTPQVTFS
jgi:cobalt-precorrin 5A hydrolase/precorrin-3B C17-methyltransferase